MCPLNYLNGFCSRCGHCNTSHQDYIILCFSKELQINLLAYLQLWFSLPHVWVEIILFNLVHLGRTFPGHFETVIKLYIFELPREMGYIYGAACS